MARLLREARQASLAPRAVRALVLVLGRLTSMPPFPSPRPVPSLREGALMPGRRPLAHARVGSARSRARLRTLAPLRARPAHEAEPLTIGRRSPRQASPRGQGGAEALLDLADLLDHVAVGDADQSGALADAGERRDEALAADEGAGRAGARMTLGEAAEVGGSGGGGRPPRRPGRPRAWPRRGGGKISEAAAPSCAGHWTWRGASPPRPAAARRA